MSQNKHLVSISRTSYTATLETMGRSFSAQSRDVSVVLTRELLHLARGPGDRVVDSS